SLRAGEREGRRMATIDRQALQRARLGRGHTQEQLAERAGVAPPTIQRPEAGGRAHPYTIRRGTKALGAAAYALGLRPPCGPWLPRLLTQSSPPGAGSSELTAHLRRVLSEFSNLDNLLGPGPLLALVPAQLAAVEQLLRGASSEEQGALLDVAARCAELAGWVHQDAGEVQAADQWTARSVDYALAGGDARLISYVLMRRSNVASDAEDAGRALGLSQAALRERDRLSPRLRAVALRQEAHAHALQGDSAACARALDCAM